MEDFIRAKTVNELEIMKKYMVQNDSNLGYDLLAIMRIQSRAMACKSATKSDEFREKGNFLMRHGNEKLEQAANLYTKAIIAAPLESKCVGLAYSNRSMALKKLGFLQAAYDDCLLALESNYPVDLRYKIYYRQAEISSELGDIENFKKHIAELDNMELNAVYKNGVEALKNKPEKELTVKIDELKTAIEESDEPNHVKIVNGQRLITTKPIKQGEGIFADQAFIICPVKDAEICHICGVNYMVPYPCVRCSGTVRYCSLKCQKEHNDVHKYECLFYKVETKDKELSNNQGTYLRLLIKGLLQLLPFLKDKNNADSLWSECFDFDKEKHNELPYMQILRAESIWGKILNNEILGYIDLCKTLVTFLDYFTNFFDLFVNTSASTNDLKIFMGAILLRHLRQRRLVYLARTRLGAIRNALHDEIHKGALHLDSTTYIYAAFVCPKLNLCEHQCSNVMVLKIDGTKLIASAQMDIPKDREMTNNFTETTSIEGPKAERQFALESFLHMKCDCLTCKTDNDQCFKNAHTFLCKSPGCKKQFSINSRTELEHDLVCYHCNELLIGTNLEGVLTGIAKVASIPSARHLTFSELRKFEQICVGNSLPKFNLYFSSIMSCLRSHTANPLNMQELDELQSISLKGLDLLKQLDINITMKIQFIMIVWDIIVLRNKVIDRTVLEETITWLKANTCKNEYIQFMKYYSNYIFPLIKND